MDEEVGGVEVVSGDDVVVDNDEPVKRTKNT